MIDGFVKAGKVPKKDVRYPMPILPSPNNIVIVVAGGEQSAHIALNSFGVRSIIFDFGVDINRGRGHK